MSNARFRSSRGSALGCMLHTFARSRRRPRAIVPIRAQRTPRLPCGGQKPSSTEQKWSGLRAGLDDSCSLDGAPGGAPDRAPGPRTRPAHPAPDQPPIRST
jgi:hypothetical protein